MDFKNINIPNKKRMTMEAKIEFICQFGKMEITNTNIKYAFDPDWEALEVFKSCSLNITQHGNIKYFVNLCYCAILESVKYEMKLK